MGLGRRRRRLNDKWLARLAAGWSGPRVELPLLPVDRGPELIATLERLLERELARGEEAAWS